MRFNITNFGILLIRKEKMYFVKSNIFEYIADPFILFQNDTKIILLVERYSRITKLGSIIRLELTIKDNDVLDIKRSNLIKEKFHLSFPCIYRVDDKYFIIPETSSINRLLLYEINNDGTQIINKTEIADGFFVDPVIFLSNNTLNLMWYDGISNNDGVNRIVKLEQFPNSNKIKLQNIIVNSKNRNAGNVIYSNHKFSQMNNSDYGKGLFIEEIQDMEPLNKNIIQIELKDLLKYKQIFENSHHVDILGDTIVFDFSYKINFLNKKKPILNSLSIFHNNITFIFI
jgi:hypothetical protein